MKNIRLLNRKAFFLNIIVPTLLTALLFIFLIFAIIIPAINRYLLDAKKEMIREIVNSASCIADNYYDDAKRGKISMETAKTKMTETLESIRYGTENKDYLWITDDVPIMLMHPYKPALIGKDVADYRDPNGKRMFSEMVKTAKQQGSGYVDYMWQWMDDSTRIVPKISFITYNENWNIIIGTGVYIEDIRISISNIINNLIWTSLGIFIAISFLLFIIVNRNLKVERKRSLAEAKLTESKEKYKTLAEASHDGTLMFVNGKCIFANKKAQEHFENYQSESIKPTLDSLIDDKNSDEINAINEFLAGNNESLRIETIINTPKKLHKNVLLNYSKLTFAGTDAVIVAIKDLSLSISNDFSLNKSKDLIHSELLTELINSNSIWDISAETFIREFVPKLNPDTTIRKLLELMNFYKTDVFITKYAENESLLFIGKEDIFNIMGKEDFDFNNSVALYARSSQDILPESSSLSECASKMLSMKSNFVFIKTQKGIKILKLCDLIHLFSSNSKFLTDRILTSETFKDIVRLHNELPLYVSGFVKAGTDISIITRTITSVSDTITNIIIDKAISNCGAPPCKFAFIALGSEGRSEQGLSTDQDNAIIFEDVAEEEFEKVFTYFQDLAEIINNQLDSSGYKLCDGDIMAKNPKWCQPLGVWKTYYNNWLKVPEPQSLLDSSIFFDFRCIYGSQVLCSNLRDFINTSIKQYPVFIKQHAILTINYKIPVSFFGRIQTESKVEHSDLFNLKNAIRLLVNMVRLYAIRYTINETNTLNRLRELSSGGFISESYYRETEYCFKFLMNMQFQEQTKKYLRGDIIDNFLDLSELNATKLSNLKNVLNSISQFQSKVKNDFGVNDNM